MRQSVFKSILGMALAGSVALVACGDGDDDDDDDGAKPVEVIKSGEGESCTRTDDCAKGLACFNLVCVEDPTPPAAGSGGGGNAGSGGRAGSSSSGGSANPGRLSGMGESCTKTSDCEPMLSCFNLRCQAAPEGEGGEQNVPAPVLGARGETCVLTSDCQPDLTCLPAPGQTGSVGVCTPKESGVEATGKTCGAECAEDTDCCELPIEEHANVGAKSCTELESLLEGVDCDASVDATELRRCFAQVAYCECDDTWSCDDGRCVYAADCSASGVVPDGCPQYTRSGVPLSTICDVDDSEKCQAPVTGCADDDECVMAPVTDSLDGDVCVEGECVCHSGSCLRKCDHDLDCAAGKVCDDDVCVPAGTCISNQACQRQLGDYRATCTDAGICTVACESDIDCNGLTGGQLANVCTDGMCQPIGCSSDDECMLTTDPPNMQRRMFCATPPAGGAATGSSAITD